MLVQRLFYRFSIVVCIVESLLFQPHPHKKNHVHKVLEGEEKIGQMHTARKNSRQMNGLKKKIMPTTIHTTLTSPAPPGNLSGWPLDVFGPLFRREPVWFDSCKGPTPIINHLILSFWLFSYVKFKCSTSHLISHIKNGSACFKHFSSHISCKMNLYSGDTNKGLLDAH